MIRTSVLRGAAAGAILFCGIPAATADVYSVIVMGKVVMADGSPPPFTVSIERDCDSYFDTNGPITDKNGQWVWRLSIDLFSQHSCVFIAHHDGYSSSTTDASNLNANYLDTTIHVPDLTLMPKVPDPYTIHISGDNFPPKSKAPFEKAMKYIDAGKYDDAVWELRASVTTGPKFAEGWHALGVVYDKTGNPTGAKEAYEKAIAANPKLFQPYVTLTRVCLILKDFRCAADTSARLIKADPKRLYPEIFLHQAVALFELNDVAGAEQSANELVKMNLQRRWPRLEFVLGRILEQKGDLESARAHMKKYLELEPKTPDAELVEGRMQALGKPEASSINPELELF